jgi:hypothetical protein
MAETFDPEAFRKRLREQLKASREAFDGVYATELEQLSGLSRDEIDAITPGQLDIQKYDALVTLLKEASRVNLAQAELQSQIKKLGKIAVGIAKKVPSLAAIL